MRSITSTKLKLAAKLRSDRAYRHRFFRSSAEDEVASQIVGLREKRGLTQSAFAKQAGMHQSAVSRLERAEYSRWGFPTLLKIAEVLDARVRILFVPAEDVIKEFDEHELEEIRNAHKPLVSSPVVRSEQAQQSSYVGQVLSKSRNLDWVTPRSGQRTDDARLTQLGPTPTETLL